MKTHFNHITLLALMLSSNVFAQQVELNIDGLDGDLKENVDAFLSAIPESEYATTLRFRGRVEKDIREALKALGYYNPHINFSVDEEDSSITVTISAGEPVRIKTLDFNIDGEASNDEDFLGLLQKSNLTEGSIVNHGDYEALKSAIQSLAMQKGYFDGRFVETKLAVSPALHEAYITLHYDSGERYHFGQTMISGSQIELERISSLQPYHRGDSYELSDVGQYSQQLSDTDWFSSVIVEPDLSSIGENSSHELPMKVMLTPAARNQLETGIGYSTDVKLRGTLKWNKPWVNQYGHSFSSRFSLSDPEQMVSASYKIPLEDVLHDYYTIRYGLKHVDNLDTQSIESNLSFARHWDLDNGWNKTLYVRYLVENYEQGVLDDVGQFVLPGVSFTRTRTRNDGHRTLVWGDKQSISVEYGNEDALSETDILRVQASSSWIRTYAKNHRGLLRVSGGANIVDDFNQVSPSLRFFAGGDNSIRGYGYESISPRDETGSLTGAQYVFTSSIEYQYRLYHDWWGAVFYDVGDAFNSTPDWKRGTGVGLRWVSPIGPLRIDFAWGLDYDTGTEFKLHFSLGPEL